MAESYKYNSCNIIEHGFDAQIDSINLCCRVTKENASEKLVLIKDYDGRKIDWNKFFNIKNELRNCQRNGGTVLQCRGCLYLKNKEWDFEDYISSININNWIKCNADCIYCDRKFHKGEKEYKIYPIIRDLIKTDKLKPPYDITIAGGEPSITRDFDKTLDLLIKNNVSPVRVLTNAIKYNKFIKKGLKQGLVNILVSTDSGTRETYKKIKSVDKHECVWKNIKKYAESQKEGALVKTKYIMLPGVNTTKAELLEFVKRNKEAGVKFACLDIEIGWFCRYSQNKPRIEPLIELFNYTKDIGSKLNIDICAFDRMQIILNKYCE